MRNFIKIADGVDVTPIRLELSRCEWSERSERKAGNSPHREMDDIWVRFRHPSELTSPEKYRDQHFAKWYPVANRLPSVRALVMAIMSKVQAVYLGGVLITRIPPGGTIYPHCDSGWHAEHHNCKVYVPIQSNADCVNLCESESVVMREGEVWTFNNLLNHSVHNDGHTDRITLIVSMRCE